MEFRDPETGEVFKNIEKARVKYCGFVDCYSDCKLYHKGRDCVDFCDEHPVEAARLMGYEVIESEEESEDGVQICEEVKAKVKEVNMEKKDKPRLAEVLGVEVGERFRIGGMDGVDFWVNDMGHYETSPRNFTGSSYAVLDAINAPNIIIRAPRLTEAEMERCRVYGAKWVSRDSAGQHVKLWSDKPVWAAGIYSAPVYEIAIVKADLFPSVSQRDCICVEEAARK